MTTKPKNKVFCKYCGQLKVEFNSDYFDEATGLRKTYLGCENESCEGHCDAVGHRWGSWFNCDKCERCGYVITGIE